jgi:hypothetical protein
MRALLLAAVSTLAVPSIADACGFTPREPAVFSVSAHGKHGTFVLLGDRAPEDASWRQLWPRSFDNTHIADAPTLEQPMRVTLVGESGVRIVSSTKKVFLSRTWRFDNGIGAPEVPAGRDGQLAFAIAIEGAQPKAKWIPRTSSAGTQEMAGWLRTHGITEADPSYIYVSRIGDSKVEALTVGDGSGKLVTLLREGTKLIGKYEGSVLGAFANQGTRWMLIERSGVLQRVYLGADA